MIVGPRNGAIAELSFAAECLRNDIHIYKPIVDMGCDFITIRNKTHLKLQIKSSSTMNKAKTGFDFGITSRGGDRNRYSDISYFIFYILPLGLSYIIPACEITQTKIAIRPNNLKCKYRKYLSAFYQLQ
jgi:hypothetical protein